MTDLITSFLTYYVRSLAERTRVEKTGTKNGFDWIIMNLALAQNWIPVRLPFIRTGPTETSRTKTEAEFGVDFAFLSQAGRRLRIFALKDEVLTYANWAGESFEKDLSMAATPDLAQRGLEDVREVEVILAYNQDENADGVRAFDLFVSSQRTYVGDHATLSFDRWNLTRIVEKVKEFLISPSLLPQRFFSQFNYLCSQVAAIHHGSDAWEALLIPNWRRFLEDAVADDDDLRAVNLIPVALIVLRQHGAQLTSFETGWIDLIEWAMLRLWRVHAATTKSAVRTAILGIWEDFYIAALDRFYTHHHAQLATENSLDIIRVSPALSPINPLAAAAIAFWHLGRLGLLFAGVAERSVRSNKSTGDAARHKMQHVVNWMIATLNANASARRPVLDIHHIELFLIWHALWTMDRKRDITAWLADLHARLFSRRLGHSGGVPFIEGSNSWSAAFERAITRERDDPTIGESSCLILMLMEFCLGLPNQEQEQLLASVHRQVVLGQNFNGEPTKGLDPIDLQSWVPPADWETRVFSESFFKDAETVTTDNFVRRPETDEPLSARLKLFVQTVESERAFKFSGDVPLAALVLACLKHQSPLPPHCWRRLLVL